MLATLVGVYAVSNNSMNVISFFGSFTFFHSIAVLIEVLRVWINFSIKLVHWSLPVALVAYGSGAYLAWKIFASIRSGYQSIPGAAGEESTGAGFRTYGATTARPTVANRSFAGAGQRLGN